MAAGSGELLQGTLGILVPKAPLAGPTHGHGVARCVGTPAGDVLRTAPAVA